MIPFTPDDRRAQFAPSQNVGGAVDRDVLDIIGAQSQPTMAAQVDYDVPDIKPVDPDVVDIVNQSQVPLMSSLMGASRVNPDQAAEANRIGSQIGVGQDIALRNMDEVRQRAFMAEVQRRDIARANPVLAGFLTDRTFANEASDDIGTLDRVGSFFADIGRAAAGRPMEYTSGELVRGYMRGQLVAERGEIGTRAILGEAEETNFARAKQIQQEMRDLTGGGILASTAEVVAQNVAQAREVVGAGLIGGAAGSVVPGIGTMTGFAGGLGTGIVLTTAKMEAGNLYLDLQEQGISDDTAVPIAVGAGLLNGVVEAVGMKIAAAPFRQLASRVMREQIAEAVRKPTMRFALAEAGKAYVVQVGSEAAEEGLQEIVNIAGEELAKGMEGIDSETTMRDAAKRVLDSFVQGAMGGAILGGVGPGANLYVDLRRAGKATKQTQFFNDLSQNATESKLKARDPGAYERFVAATADGTGAETVFVDGATMRDVLTQAGVTDAQLEAIVPGVAQQVRQAAELGNDVTLPTAQFAGRLAGTPLGDALLPHMRLSPDAMSAMEAQQFAQSREALVEEARALLEAKTEAESAFVQEANQVFSSMRERLVAAGRDPALADIEALMHQAFVVTQAANRGMTPAQFEAESGLREIVGAEMPAAPLEQAARLDADYMAAVERGDMDAARRMVDEAAKAAGYGIKAFHGSASKPFWVFDPARRGERTGSNSALLGFFASSERQVATEYQLTERERRTFNQPTALVYGLQAAEDEQQRAYDIETSAIQDAEQGGWLAQITKTDQFGQPYTYDDGFVYDTESEASDAAEAERVSEIEKTTKRVEKELARFQDEERELLAGRTLHDLWVRLENPLVYDFQGGDFRDKSYSELVQEAVDTGHDGVIMKNTIDSIDSRTPSDVIVFFHSNQAKLADPVTRDESGNIVPLSRRFDITSPRIFEQAAVPASLDVQHREAIKAGDIATAQALTDAAAESRMPDSKVRDEAGKILRVFHGTQRIDRVGNRLLKKRATSGPMPFFTNTRPIAEGYAQGKQDTSIEDIGYEQWIKYTPKGQRSKVTLDQAWFYLTPEQKATAKERLFTTGYENPDEGTGAIVGNTDTIASRSHVEYMLREARGNALTAAKELWLNSGSLFNDEQQFMDVLKGMGLTERFVYDSPHAVNSGIVEAYLNITNPLDTAAIPESVVEALQQRANRIRKPTPQYGRDHWDKEVREPQAWMQTLRNDMREGRTQAWTSIPDWVTDVLRRRGYDGIKDMGGKFGGEQHTVWIPFEPEQVKFANAIAKDASGRLIPLSERFDVTSPMMYFQAAASPAFYSALEREVAAIDAKALTAAGWGERFKGLISKGAIKADELEWSGLNDYLKMQEGKVSKDTVLEFLKNNGVQVRTVRIGAAEREAAVFAQMETGVASARVDLESAGGMTPEVESAFNEYEAMLENRVDDRERSAKLQKQINDALLANDLVDLDSYFEDSSAAQDEAVAQPKYGQYTLPGGTNYREVLLTLPGAMTKEQRIAARDAAEQKIKAQPDYPTGLHPMRFASWAREHHPDLYQTWSEANAAAESRPSALEPGVFRSTHWNQPNVLVHLRMNDRVDADGKRVLFVEEVQSDWGQAGVKRGFVNQRAADEAELAELLAQQEANPTDARKKQIARVQERITKDEYNIARAPYVETTDGWLNLGLKQIMLEAVRGNYDRVAFVNGEQSADRYDLAQQVSLVSVSKQADGRFLTYIEGVDGTALIRNRDGFSDAGQKAMTAEELEATVGKEVAKQAIEGKPNKDGWVDVRGDNLRVGGEGMKSFYDNIVPAAMGKLLKKYRGGKVGTVEIDMRTPESEAYYAEPTDADILPQPGFDITPELVKKLESGLPLFQAMPVRGPARGGYDPSRLKILFGKGADFTTGAHELTHYYVDYYTKQAMAGTATPQMLADLDAMFKFMGVAGDTPQARLAAFNAMPFETARPLIETITYNAEVYLFEGKAPSLELAGVFDRMLAFFRRAYKSLADFVTQQQEIYRREFGRELPALNDDLRAVFDRMLADERQIKQAQAVAQMRGQFTVKPEGMDDAEWAAYQEMAGEATNAAIADMTKASLRQMEWLSRARNRIIKELQARHTAQRKEVRERVQKEVQQEPLYRAMAFLRRGQVVAPDGTVTEAEGVHRIDRVLAAEFAPTVDLAALGGRYGVLQDDGLHPDIVAEMFGYPTGGTLLEALAAAKPMREAVEDRTDAEMLRLYGEMNTPEAREQEIQKALHNEARARLVGVELRFMGKIQQPVRVLMEAARQAAQQVIDRKRVGELRPSEFVAAEAKASREATAAMQDNKPDMAVRAKRAQLLNNQLAKAALEVKDEIDTDIRYLRRVLRDSNRQRMGADVADQIASLLDRFNIAPMTADEARRVGTLAEFLASLEDRGLVPDIAEAIGMRDTRIPYKNMTIGEFRELVDAVKQLEYVGKNERKILLAKEKAEFGAVRDQIVASVIENAGDRKANARTATTNIGRAVTAMKGFAAAHLKAASIVRILDGGKDGGPLWNFLIRSANEAGDSETSMRAEATADLTKILEPVFRAGKLGGKGVFYPSINRSLNREARLVVALNMGNAGNMQRLLDGEGWSMEAVMPVLQSLTEDELNTVQQIWDYFEKYRPMIGQKERRLYGKEPAWVEPQPLVVRSADGKTVTLRGGYYPIKYDPRASLRAETMSEADEAKRDLAGAYTTATTRRSFVKARVRKVEGRPLLYTLAGMYGGINDVIHDLTWHEWLIQANRLMRSNSFDDAVRNRYGPEYVAQLKNWIKDVAAGERGVQNEAEMALNFLRQGISSAGLGFNIVSAAMQITGFNQSIVRVGARWIGRGIAYVAQNPMVAMREVNEKSEFMRNRIRTQFRELNEIRNMVQGQSVAMRRVQMGTYFLMMRMQRMVDVPTWHGAYEKAMYEGRDEETAIALADQAVIDSQGSGMVKDLARVERGGPAVKLFTVFYGYMNTVYNMAAVQTMTNKNKGKLAADYAMLFVVPVVLSYMLKQALIPRKGDEDEEWDMGKIGRELAAEQLSYLMGTMVIAREFGEVGKMIFGVEGPRMGYGGPAGLRAIGETYQFATQASQGEFDTAFRKSAVNMIGAFTGLPSAQVNRTLDGLEALYEGETKNVLAPLTGAKKR